MLGCGPFILLNHFWRLKRIDTKNCLIKFFMLILVLPLGLIIDPFIWIFTIIWIIPQTFRFICEWIQKRR